MNSMFVKPADLSAAQIGQGRPVERPTATDSASFGDWLKESIASVNKMQEEGDQAARKLITGENQDIHGTMIAMQKANISMSLMMEVRNKIISAYEEIKRMQF